MDTKSIVISATTSMAGVGLANVIDKGVKAARIVQTGTKVAAAVKVASDVAVNGTISAVSQSLKDGKVNGDALVADMAVGFIGGKAGEKVKSLRQNSANGKVLSRQADHARRVAGNNPRVSRAEKLRVATQKSQAYGDNAANATNITITNTTSIMVNKLFDDDKFK